MRIVVVGAGGVGSHLAERLSADGQHVIVVESDVDIAREVQSTVDCLVVPGNGASRQVLEAAEIKDADLLIAVTSSDAVNIMACHAAARLGVPRTVARVEDPALRAETEILGVDIVIDPGETLANDILNLVQQGGVSEHVEFGDGQLVMLGGYVPESSPIAGGTLADLRAKVSGWNWIVTAIIRDGHTSIARGDSNIEVGDHVLVMAKADRTEEAVELLGLAETHARKVMVLGATRLARLVAERIANAEIQTILIDQDLERCKEIAAGEAPIIAVHGDPTDPKVLKSEGVENVDAVLALTGWDEINILGSLVAKALGVRMTIARFSRMDLIRMLPGLGIDAAVSSKLAASDAILRFLRRGMVHTVVSFQDSDAEAMDFQVDDGSPAVGKSLAELHLHHSAIIGGVLRGDKAFIPLGSTVIQGGDRLIVFALPDAIGAVEKLFG